MSDEQAMSERIEAVFRAIEQTRMAGVPILNGALSVEVVGLQAWTEHWFCVLVTPWFMNMMLLPREPRDPAWDELRPGESVRQVLPGGSFSFLVGREEGLGAYQACSLFSPVFEFAAQDQAVDVAQAVIAEVMKGQPQADPEKEQAEAAPSEKIESPSRRKLFGRVRDVVAGDSA